MVDKQEGREKANQDIARAIDVAEKKVQQQHSIISELEKQLQEEAQRRAQSQNEVRDEKLSTTAE